VIECLQGPYDPGQRGVRAYDNMNFALLGYLIPLYLQPDLKKSFDDLTAKGAWTLAERDKNLQLVLGDRMMIHLRDDVLPRAPGEISLSCDAANVYKATGAYGYKAKGDTGKGIITSRKASGKPCSGSGGNWISARHLASFVATTFFTDRILSERARNLMYRDDMPSGERLVWSEAKSEPWLKDNFGLPAVVWSGGDQNYGGGQSFEGVVVRLPDAYYLVLLVNSGGMGTRALKDAGVAAFKAGMAANFD